MDNSKWVMFFVIVWRFSCVFVMKYCGSNNFCFFKIMFFHVIDMVCVCWYNVSVPIGLYGFQHYLSMLGSIILIPLVIVPAMGGTYVSSYKIYFFFIKKNVIHLFTGWYNVGSFDLTGFSLCRRILEMLYLQCFLFRE